MFFRRNGSASTPQETRTHTHARFPEAGCQCPGCGASAESSQNSAVPGPLFGLSIRFIKPVRMQTWGGVESGCGLRFVGARGTYIPTRGPARKLGLLGRVPSAHCTWQSRRQQS